jgi:hypothetical protein
MTSELERLVAADTSKLTDGELRQLMMQAIDLQEADRRESGLLYYRPNPTAGEIHLSKANVVGIGGGNGSGKTEHALVELVMCASGVFPDWVRESVPDWRDKFRGPISCRVVVESLTTTLHTIILPKLKWWVWTGLDQPGGSRGHWGWVPRLSLVGANWDRSWSEKLRTLRVVCRDPDDPGRVLGESTIQFMSVDQDPSDFASGDFHIIVHDEPPTYAIWRENQARTMRVAGRLILAMTWPDDPSIPVDWLFDEVYEPAQPGMYKNPHIDWINLFTTDNPHLNQDAVALQAESWSDAVRQVRIYGQPIRFSNRVHALFTDQSLHWCFQCGKVCILDHDRCSTCKNQNTISFCHVEDFEAVPGWPTLFFLDPHPRKPHKFCWIQVSPQDDLWQVAEGSVDDDPVSVREYAERVEEDLHLNVTARIIDPNMGRSPANARIRRLTWQEEFDNAGLRCDLGDDSDVGRMRINQYLQPDSATLHPRITVHPRCTETVFQMKRYVWDDFRAALEREAKQRPKAKNDDFPTLWRYCLNLNPTFRQFYSGAPILRRFGAREPTEVYQRPIRPQRRLGAPSMR